MTTWILLSIIIFLQITILLTINNGFKFLATRFDVSDTKAGTLIKVADQVIAKAKSLIGTIKDEE